MSKVDQLNDSVHHRVAQGNQGINAPPRQTADEKFKEIFHSIYRRMANSLFALIGNEFGPGYVPRRNQPDAAL
jgi:DNA-binding cell septation regulator SpoVG